MARRPRRPRAPPHADGDRQVVPIGQPFIVGSRVWASAPGSASCSQARTSSCSGSLTGSRRTATCWSGPTRAARRHHYEAEHYAEHVARHQDAPLAATDVVELTEPIDLLAAPTDGDAKRLGVTTLVVPAGSRFHRWSRIVQIPGIDHLFQPVSK